MVYDSPLGDLELGEVQMAAGELGLELISFKIRRTEDLALAFDALNDRADALYVANGGFFGINGILFNTSALHAPLPTMRSAISHHDSASRSEMSWFQHDVIKKHAAGPANQAALAELRYDYSNVITARCKSRRWDGQIRR
jgi:hypothetical protein